MSPTPSRPPETTESTSATRFPGGRGADDRRLRLRSRVMAATGGVLAAAVALASGEFVGEVLVDAPSPVYAVADVFVDESPGGLVSWSIDTFGGTQQTILVWGIVLASLCLGGLLGLVALRSRPAAFGGFVAFGVVGWWAGGRDLLATSQGAFFSSAVAAASGIAVMDVLDRFRRAMLGRSGASTTIGAEAGPPPPPAPDESSAAPLGGNVSGADDARRRFLAVGAGAAAWAAVAPTVGRWLGPSDPEVSSDLLAELPLSESPAVPDGSTLDQVEGLASYITPNDDFYLIDTALRAPVVEPDDWTLQIRGMVDDELEFTFEDLAAMELEEHIITLSCVSNEVGGDLVGNARWSGVRLDDLLARAGVRDDATQIVGRSVDGWTAGFPTATLDGRPALVALTMNGEPLPIEHGFPARLVVPGLYGYVSATKWLQEIELTTLEAFDAYWIQRGWAKEGPILTQSRIDVPRGGATVAGSPTVIAGVAWAPHRGVERVEVRVDDGDWLEARLNDEITDNAWRQWVLRTDLAPGRHTATVRATDETGTTQTSERSTPIPRGATGRHRVDFSVA